MRLGLAAIQLEVDLDALASADRYRAHVEDAVARALATADALGGVDHRVVVLPELCGHLALLALAPPAARRAKTLGGAIAASAVRRPMELLRGIATTRVWDVRHAVLGAIAPEGERWWRGVAGQLARRHGAYVVAGSHLRLGAGGELTSASFTFSPDGKQLALTQKVNLLPAMEDRSPNALGLARGDEDHVPVLDTAFGRLCSLVGYDAFVEPHSTEERFVPMGEALAARGGATLIANPSSNVWPWREPWPPARFAGKIRDASARDRAAQWRAEGLAATLAAHPIARWGITAHLVGQLLGLRFDGQSEILAVDGGGDGTDGRSVQTLARAERHDRGESVVAVVTC